MSGWLVGERQDFVRQRRTHHRRASLSAYGRGARNYFTYFFVYSARRFVPARGLRQSRGHQWGEAVSELGLIAAVATWAGCDFETDGVGRRCFVLPLLIGV